MNDALSDGWQPDQYARFRDEREQPFHDLLALVSPVPGGRVVDLGCGTGALTRVLHEHTQAAETVGVDRSDAMLDQSAQHAGEGVRFERGDIAAFAGSGLDVVFANASLQWVDDHETLFPQLASTLKPGGQLAVQMPSNNDHVSHTRRTSSRGSRGTPQRWAATSASIRCASPSGTPNCSPVSGSRSSTSANRSTSTAYPPPRTSSSGSKARY